MTYKEVSQSNAIDIKTMKDEAVEGIYLGLKHITTDFGPQVIYRLQQGPKIQGIYGFTNLDRAMESIVSGTKLRLTYLGTENVKTKYGMKDVHQVSVMVDEDASEKPSNVDEDL